MATTKIMCVGDSITNGYLLGVATESSEGYRLPLWESLSAGGYDVDFVGPVQRGTSALRDQDSAGYNGWAIDPDINGSVNAWLATYAPDVMLLVAGTNDLAAYDGAGNGISGPIVAARMTALLAQIQAARPSVKILLGSPPYMSSRLFEFTRYVALLPGVVATAQAAGQYVRYVDMSTVAVADEAGHPTLAGYATMAGLWHAALVRLLGTPSRSYLNRMALWGAG